MISNRRSGWMCDSLTGIVWLMLLSALGACSQMSRTSGADGGLDGSDWGSFAEKMIDAEGLEKALEPYRGPNGEPAVLAIGDFVNKTTLPRVNDAKDFMYAPLRSTLSRRGAARVREDIGGSGADLDSLVNAIRKMANSPSLEAPDWDPQVPRLVLHGSFHELRNSTGRTTNSDYKAWLRLIDVYGEGEPIAVWEGEVDLRQSFTRALIGG